MPRSEINSQDSDKNNSTIRQFEGRILFLTRMIILVWALQTDDASFTMVAASSSAKHCKFSHELADDRQLLDNFVWAGEECRRFSGWTSAKFDGVFREWSYHYGSAVFGHQRAYTKRGWLILRPILELQRAETERCVHEKFFLLFFDSFAPQCLCYL